MLYKIQHNLIDINRDLYIRHNDSRTRGLEEGIPVRFVVGSFLEKAMLASCPAVVMPNI
jgi:hypothetical protein